MSEIPDPISYLQRLVRDPDPQLTQMVRDRDGVYRQYGRMFARDNLDQMSSEDFKAFLLYDNNRHWWSIHRQQAKIIADMDLLRSELKRLLDESVPIRSRIDRILTSSYRKPIPGLGRAVTTPILHVVYPDLYAVWNTAAEDAMVRLKLWPRFGSGWSIGQKYEAVNAAIHEAAEAVGVDLWTIDSLWWLTEREHAPDTHQFTGGTGAKRARSSALGRPAKAASTFTCSACYQNKATHLESADTRGVCSDCA